MRLLAFTACCLAAAACSAPPPEEAPVTDVDLTEEAPPPERRESRASVEGVVDGEAVTMTSAVAVQGSLSAREPDRRGVRIVVANHEPACAPPSVLRPGARVLTLDVESTDLAARTYVVPEPLSGQRGVDARFDVVKAECRNTTILARAGRVTIDGGDGATLRGTFDLVLGRERLRGRFEATYCATPPSGLVDLGGRCEP